MPPLSALIALLPALLLLSCAGTSPSGGGCTEMGCGPGFSINFQRQGAWEPGAYTVKVTVDGAPFTCSATIPLSCDAPSACPEDAPFVLGLSGCALEPSQHSLLGIELKQGTAPASIQVDVAQDGKELGTGTFTPTYTTSQPNGPDCEPVCKSAPTVAMSLQ